MYFISGNQRLERLHGRKKGVAISGAPRSCTHSLVLCYQLLVAVVFSLSSWLLCLDHISSHLIVLLFHGFLFAKSRSILAGRAVVSRNEVHPANDVERNGAFLCG